jgi:hypothetical protein
MVTWHLTLKCSRKCDAASFFVVRKSRENASVLEKFAKNSPGTLEHLGTKPQLGKERTPTRLSDLVSNDAQNNSFQTQIQWRVAWVGYKIGAYL